MTAYETYVMASIVDDSFVLRNILENGFPWRIEYDGRVFDNRSHIVAVRLTAFQHHQDLKKR